MQTAFEIARALSAAAFLAYGIACLATPRMDAEFERYGLARFRRLIGAIECLGAIGLVVGHFNRPVLVLAAAGLTLTMVAAIATRIRLRDSLAQTLPAVVLLAVNAFVLGVAVARGAGSSSSRTPSSTSAPGRSQTPTAPSTCGPKWRSGSSTSAPARSGRRSSP